MNYPLGFFRLWAAVSAVWIAFSGFITYNEVLDAYKLTKARETYDYTFADGRKFQVIAPSKYDANTVADDAKEKLSNGEGLAAPNCKNDTKVCEPQDRRWDEGGIKLLPGATVTDDGIIKGPFALVAGDDAFKAAKDHFPNTVIFMLSLCLIPPVALGFVMLGLGWVIKGFRTTT